MTYAQILAGFIVNVIVLDDASLLPLFFVNPLGGKNFDFVKPIDNLVDQNGNSAAPQIGWSYQPVIYPALDFYTSPDGTQVIDGNG
jgi:hypothetical protein